MPSSASSATTPQLSEASGFKTLFTFDGKNGSEPLAAMIAVHGVLYGAASAGGAHNAGVLFSVTPAGKQTVVANLFTHGRTPTGSLIALNGVLYGTASIGPKNGNGAIFAYKTDGTALWTTSFKGQYNGISPEGGLIELKGALYGTTRSGGNPTLGGGAFYKVTLSGKETPLYAFQGSPDGLEPQGNLVAIGDVMYGTTASGGLNGNNGTAFSVTRFGAEKVIYPFDYTHGGSPAAGLILFNGTLYGTTAYGGAHYLGTVFSVTTAGKEHVLHSFVATSADGNTPDAPLIAYNGKLYGTTSRGGSNGYGTVFEIDTSGRERVLHSFRGGNDGAVPMAGLVALNGVLYGTTSGGFRSSVGHGTVFALTPK